MSLFKVTVNGRAHIVDAATKAAAKAYGAKKLEVEVVPATTADLQGLDLAEIPTVLPRGKEKAEGEATGEAAAE